MKPRTPVAMQLLIDKVHETLPFDAPESTICSTNCNGCSLKLLEYLDTELMDWQARLQRHDIPDLADINQLSKLCHKVYRVIKRNGLLEAQQD